MVIQMKKHIYQIARYITLYRLITAPLLFLLLLAGAISVFRWGLLISFLTDSIDGYIARKSNTATREGARLDSVADDLTVAAGVTGTAITNWEFWREHAFVIIGLALLFVVQTGVALIRYGKTTSFHTLLAKLAAIIQAFFLIGFFFIGPVNSLFYVAVIITAMDLIEEFLMVLVLREYHTNVKGIIHALRLRS